MSPHQFHNGHVHHTEAAFEWTSKGTVTVLAFVAKKIFITPQIDAVVVIDLTQCRYMDSSARFTLWSELAKR